MNDLTICAISYGSSEIELLARRQPVFKEGGEPDTAATVKESLTVRVETAFIATIENFSVIHLS